MYSPGRGKPGHCIVMLYVGEGSKKNNATCWALGWLSARCPTTHKQIGPSGADSQVGGFVYILGPCGSLQWTLLWSGSHSHHLNPHGFFQVEVLRLYYPELEPWVARSVSFPSSSSCFICMQMWNHLVCQPLPCPPWSSKLLPCLESSPSSCLSQPLLLFWMNVSSLTPWLSDFHTVRFSGSSGYLFLLNFLLSFFWCARRQSVSTYASILPGSLHIDF